MTCLFQKKETRNIVCRGCVSGDGENFAAASQIAVEGSEGVLQCVKVCCSVLQYAAVTKIESWSVSLQCIAVCCSVLQCVAVCSPKSIPGGEYVAAPSKSPLKAQSIVLQYVAVRCSVMQEPKSFVSDVIHSSLNPHKPLSQLSVERSKGVMSNI